MADAVLYRFDARARGHASDSACVPTRRADASALIRRGRLNSFWHLIPLLGSLRALIPSPLFPDPPVGFPEPFIVRRSVAPIRSPPCPIPRAPRPHADLRT